MAKRKSQYDLLSGSTCQHRDTNEVGLRNLHNILAGPRAEWKFLANGGYIKPQWEHFVVKFTKVLAREEQSRKYGLSVSEIYGELMIATATLKADSEESDHEWVWSWIERNSSAEVGISQVIENGMRWLKPQEVDTVVKTPPESDFVIKESTIRREIILQISIKNGGYIKSQLTLELKGQGCIQLQPVNTESGSSIFELRLFQPAIKKKKVAQESTVDNDGRGIERQQEK